MDDFEKLKQEIDSTKQKLQEADVLIDKLRSELAAAEKKADAIDIARSFGHEFGSLGTVPFGTAELLQTLMNRFKRTLKKAAEGQNVDWEMLKISEKIERMRSNLLTVGDALSDFKLAILGEPDRTKYRNHSFQKLWESAKSESIAATSNCEFQVDYPENFSILGNKFFLRRVFVNLINNACEAMKEQEKKLVILKADYEEGGFGKTTRFEFTDNGPGIPWEIQKKIFSPGISTKQDDDSSHGHGLYLCKRYIEYFHYGKIKVRSNPGEGATFTFWIPWKE